MNYIRRIAVTIVSLTLGMIGLTVSSSAAFATLRPAPGGGAPAKIPAPVASHVASGTAGWEVTLAALAVALVAVCLTVLTQRIARHHTVRFANA